MKILSFDISSTTIGYAVFEFINNNINFISCDFIKPKKDGSIILRLFDTREKIKKIIEHIKPDYIIIEQIVEFMKNKSTAKTIITLTAFNRMIALLSYDLLQREPIFYSVMSIRHGIKQNKIFPKKEDIPELVAKHLNIKFPYIYDKKSKIKIENYDMADAIAVGLYHCLKSKNLKINKSKGKK